MPVTAGAYPSGRATRAHKSCPHGSNSPYGQASVRALLSNRTGKPPEPLVPPRVGLPVTKPALMKPALLEALLRRWVEPAVHLAAHLEHRKHSLGHRDHRAATWISSGACAAPLGREHAKPTQLNPVPLRQRIRDRVEDRVDDVCRVLLVEVRVLFGDLQDEFGLDHRSLERSTRTGQTKGPPNAGRGGVREASRRRRLALLRYHV